MKSPEDLKANQGLEHTAQGIATPAEQADPSRFSVTLDGSVPLVLGIRIAERIAELGPRLSPDFQTRLATHPKLGDLTEDDRRELAEASAREAEEIRKRVARAEKAWDRLVTKPGLKE